MIVSVTGATKGKGEKESGTSRARPFPLLSYFPHASCAPDFPSPFLVPAMQVNQMKDCCLKRLSVMVPAIIIVLAFPPKLSLRSQVSTELRYGMKSFFLTSLMMAFSLASAD